MVIYAACQVSYTDTRGVDGKVCPMQLKAPRMRLSRGLGTNYHASRLKPVQRASDDIIRGLPEGLKVRVHLLQLQTEVSVLIEPHLRFFPALI